MGEMATELLEGWVPCRMVAEKGILWDANPYPFLTPLISSGQLCLGGQKPRCERERMGDVYVESWQGGYQWFTLAQRSTKP